MSEHFKALFVVEYSVSQDAFHVCTVAEMIEANADRFVRRARNDFMPIDFAPTYEAAAAVVAKLRPAASQLIASDRASRAERVREEFGVLLSLSDFD